MCADSAKPAETVTATIDLTFAGRKGRLEVPVPTGPTRPVELLPLLRSLTDTFVRIAVENVESTGASISCRKGCGACCRQLVPISEVEAESIRDIVQQLPEARRAVVIERFEQARQRLGAAGLLESLRAPAQCTREDLLPLGVAYFEQRIPCPFLEEESCSIHDDRPLSCREYLVVSPAANCARPTPSTIDCVKMPVKVSNAMRHLDPDTADTSPPWIPLVLALEWPATDRIGGEPRTGTAQVAALLGHLFGQEIEEPKTATATADPTSCAPVTP